MSVESVGRVMAGRRSRLSSLPPGTLSCFLLGSASHICASRRGSGFAEGSWIARAFLRPVASLGVLVVVTGGKGLLPGRLVISGLT